MRNASITIHKKVPLRNVESLIDRSEPRNLILGFVHTPSKQGAASNLQKLNQQTKKKSILAFRQP